MMNRREALKRVAWIMGGTVVGAQLFLEGCVPKTPAEGLARLFEKDSVAVLGDLADAILPPTSTPGAKEAGVGDFIPVMVRDCYTKEDQDVVLEGLDLLDAAAENKFGKKFQKLDDQQRFELVVDLDKEAKEHQKNRTDEMPNHYFHLLKQTTLLGYFTSELGATKALRYVQVPGRYDGDVPYKKGDRAWA